MRAIDKKLLVTGGICVLFAVVGPLIPEILAGLNILAAITCFGIFAHRKYRGY